jgi:hypothetical protein
MRLLALVSDMSSPLLVRSGRCELRWANRWLSKYCLGLGQPNLFNGCCKLPPLFPRRDILAYFSSDYVISIHHDKDAVNTIHSSVPRTDLASGNNTIESSPARPACQHLLDTHHHFPSQFSPPFLSVHLPSALYGSPSTFFDGKDGSL